MKKLNKTLGLLVLTSIVIFCVSSADVMADPVVDGRYDPAEGYTEGHSVEFQVEGVATPVTGGLLWLHQNPITRDLFLFFSQPKTLVDNTYGKNSIGWGKNVAPSGKKHNFNDLKGSDKARFVFTDDGGALLLDITMDYLSETSKHSGVYDCLGVTGGDGKVHSGPGSAVTEWATSLDYNFNTLGFILTEDSPATDNDYTTNPDYPGWIYDVTYEMRIDGSLFTGDFGDALVTEAHNSPNKIGKNFSTTEVNGEIPEPATMTLMGLGVFGVLGGRRLRRRKSKS